MRIDEALLEELLAKAAASPRMRMSHDLRTSPEDQSQRILNALIPGTILPIHRHRASAETVILLKGRMDEVLYNENKEEIDRIRMNKETGCYGAQIPQGAWHSVEVHEPSVIVEVKDGAYQPLTLEDVLD